MPKLLCHCFGYTDDDIKEDLLRNGHSTIFERIISAKKSGGCQCLEKNPQGR
jgi:hypothetical protein